MGALPEDGRGDGPAEEIPLAVRAGPGRRIAYASTGGIAALVTLVQRLGPLAPRRWRPPRPPPAAVARLCRPPVHEPGLR